MVIRLLAIGTDGSWPSWTLSVFTQQANVPPGNRDLVLEIVHIALRLCPLVSVHKSRMSGIMAQTPEVQRLRRSYVAPKG
jgi:hypothetical protein